MIQIDIFDDYNLLQAKEIGLYQELVRFAAKKEVVKANAELSISFVSNEAIKQINRDYRDKDEVTDVISFALQDHPDEKEIQIDKEMPLALGDIVISYDRAKEQAEEYGHSLKREIGFLIVHGFLHLLGYDHMNEADEKLMFSKQNEILGEFGLER